MNVSRTVSSRLLTVIALACLVCLPAWAEPWPQTVRLATEAAGALAQASPAPTSSPSLAPEQAPTAADFSLAGTPQAATSFPVTCSYTCSDGSNQNASCNASLATCCHAARSFGCALPSRFQAGSCSNATMSLNC